MNIKTIKKNKQLLQFSSFHMLSSFAFAILLPFYSIILLEKGFTLSQVSLFFVVFSIGVILFSPIMGKLSDRHGRKKIILFGLSLETLFYLSYFFVENQTVLLTLRFFEALAYSSIFFVMVSAFEDMISEKRGFWTGVYMSIGTIGTLLGPIIAGIISSYSSPKILLLGSCLLIISCIIFLSLLPEKKQLKKEKTKLTLNPISEIYHFLQDKKLRGAGIIMLLMISTIQFFSIYLPIYLIEELQLPTYYLGFLLAIPIAFELIQFYFGKITDSISSEFGIVLGIVLTASPLLFFPYVESLLGIIYILLLHGLGKSIWSINGWNLIGTKGEDLNKEGELVGTYVSLGRIGTIIVILSSTFIIEDIGIDHTIQILGIILLSSLLYVYFLFQPIFHKPQNIFHSYIKHKHK